MQGQKSQFRTLEKNFLPVNGSTSNGDAVDCQMTWNDLQNSALIPIADYQPLSNETNDNQPAEWCFGESSSSAARRSGVSDETKLDQAWRASCLQEMNCENRELPSVAGIPLAYTTQDLNMSAEYEDEVEEDEEYLSDHHPRTFRGTESSRECPDRRSSDSLELLSGYHGLVMEEREDDPGFSLDAPRMPYKRKAIEVRSGHFSGSGGSERAETSQCNAHRFPQVAANDLNLSLPAQDDLIMNNRTERANSRIRIGVSQNPNASEHPESSNRNSHLRTSDFRMQDLGHGNQFLTGNSSLQHGSGLPLRDYMFDLTPASGVGYGIHRGQSISQSPTPIRGNHQTRSNRGSSRRNSSVSTEMTSRNVPRIISEHHPMFLPGNEIRNSIQHSPNSNSSVEHHPLEGNAGSSYRPGGSRYSSSSLSLRSGSRYHLRLSEMMRRSLLPSARVHNNNHPIPASSSASQNVGIQSVQDNHRRHVVNSRSALLERHLDGAFEVPHSLRTLTTAAGEGRRNTMTEQIRHVLDLMRRGESLRFEDMMFLDHSILFGMAEMHDRHRDMRMDVDNMSYEELLALEERIGNVCTGLSEEAIANNLKKWKYGEIIGVDDEMEKTEPCCICREEYVTGDEVGELSCGHDFHTHCIKQWLMQKNLCPICKTTGLNI